MSTLIENSTTTVRLKEQLKKSDVSLSSKNQISVPSWLNPPSIYRPAPFWSWNNKLEPSRLCRQIESMHRAGMGGFFMHSRYGLKTEYLSNEWFNCVSTCIEKARVLGLKAYLYDEDRWPSGSNGGMITRDNDNFRMQILTGRVIKLDELKGLHLGVFEIKLDAHGFLESYKLYKELISNSERTIVVFDVITQPPSAWQNDGTYLDTMNPDAVAAFINNTHEKYKMLFSKDFGGVIPALFTDEPNYGFWSVGRKDDSIQCPWSRYLREEFIKRRGYDLVNHLPEIIFISAGQKFSKVRYDYFRTISELFVENFTKQIASWCDKNAIPLTGHLLLEEPQDAQTSAVGSCMPHYEYMQWPGIDMLTDQSKQWATVKQCTSVADQLGKERVLSELYGCTGWDWPLEGHKFMADWQFAGGVNLLCSHLSHYSLEGGAKRDYPASILDHSPWWPYYKTVQDYLSRTSYMLTKGTPIRDILVVHPIESTWGQFNFNRTCEDVFTEKLEPSLHDLIYGLTENHHDWDFGDESLIAKYGKVEDRQFVMGKMRYKVIIMPPMLTLRSTTLDMLDTFTSVGGTLIWLSPFAAFVDGLPSSKLASVISKSQICHDFKSVLCAVNKKLDRNLSVIRDDIECREVWALLKRVDGHKMLFMQSQNRHSSFEATVVVKNAQAPVVCWNAINGSRHVVDCKVVENGLMFSQKFDPSGSAILTFGIPVPDAEIPVIEANITNRQKFAGPFDVELTELNTLPLDYCRFSFGDEKLSEFTPVLKVDEILRKRFGLSTRFGLEQQPYYLRANNMIDTRPRGSVRLEFSFHITQIPTICKLVIENPQDYTIKVNGLKVNKPAGYWIDEDLKTIDIHDCLQNGDNMIVLDFNYRTDMELEDIYLAGNFGVCKKDSSKVLAPDNLSMTSEVKELKLGSWVGQGLEFYGGAVKYKIPLQTVKKNSKRIFVRLEDVACTAAVVHIGDKSTVLPWAPFTADISDAVNATEPELVIEIIGGRKNILGPLHVPNLPWTGPDCFVPDNPKWKYEYQLNSHGINSDIIIEYF